MAELIPFRAVLYNERVVGDLATVVTPPYDVITPLDQDRYYQSHPHNFIRLILGRSYRTDGVNRNQYLRAQRLLRHWLKEHVFKWDRSQAYYLYCQEFLHGGRKMVRLGCVGLLRLEPYQVGRVMPHEDTFPDQVRDRFELLKATRADLSPVFAVAFDPQARLDALLQRAWDGSEPFLQVDTEGVRHVIRRLVNPQTRGAIRELMMGLPLVIADGHHRYEAALQYRDALARAGRLGLMPGASHVMTFVMSSANPGVAILPTHRLIRLSSTSVASLMERLRAIFEVLHSPSGKMVMAQLRQRSGPAQLGLLTGDQWHLLRVRSPMALKELEETPQGWRQVDAVILHEVILHRLLGLSEDELRTLITYTRDDELAVSLVRRGDYALGFFLSPPTFETIYAVAQSGYRMPRKTTYFFPKVLAGLLIHLIQPRRYRKVWILVRKSQIANRHSQVLIKGKR